jgi:hypothetical protein
VVRTGRSNSWGCQNRRESRGKLKRPCRRYVMRVECRRDEDRSYSALMFAAWITLASAARQKKD